MKTKLFHLRKTTSSNFKPSRKANPFKKLRTQRGFSLRPGKMFFVFLVSVLFFITAIAAYQLQPFFPKFGVRTTEVISPNVSASSLGVFNAALKQKGIQFDTMKVATESPTVVVFLSKGGYAYLDLNTDVEAQVSLLSRILSRITVDNPNKKIKYIDLRHEKAIVGFQSP